MDVDQANGPPVPMFPVGPMEDSESPSSVNRLTLRYLSIRERGNEAYQDFPQNEYVGCEVPVEHFKTAYVVPDMPIDSLEKLNFGWIQEPRLVVILNRTVWRGSIKPSEAQRLSVASSVLLVGFSSDYFPIRLEPKQQQPLLLSKGVELFVKAESGKPIISIFAV